VPKISIGKTAQSYELFIELPGVDQTKVKVAKIKRDVIEVSGEKISELSAIAKEKGTPFSVLKEDRFYGTFSEKFTIPEPFKVKPTQEWKNSVLHLTCPVSKILDPQ